jgi:hypothetical protein
MPSNLDTMPVPLYHSGNGALDVTCMAASAEAALASPPPAGGAGAYAVRSALRSTAVMSSALTLQRCAGIALSMMAWLVMLAGLAHLCVAALRNREGELGLGLDATIHGAEACLASLAIGAVGVPLWVLAELRLRRRERVVHKEEPIETL